jgi:hypothetical protein
MFFIIRIAGIELSKKVYYQSWELGGSHLSSQAMWENEIGRIVVPGQPGQKVCETPSQRKKAGHYDACTCHASESRNIK